MEKRKNICFFVGNIENSGGTERVTTLIANKLSERGYNISILSYERGKKSYFKLNDNINIYTLINDEKLGKIKKQFYPSYILYKFINDNNIDLIIDVDILLSIYTLPVKLFSRVKIISWEHFNLKNNNGVKKRDYARFLASKFANKIIVLNKSDMKAYQRKFNGIKNITYIYNPSPFENEYGVENKKRENTIISVGRLTKVKGFDLLLDAWKSIEHIHQSWSLEIVGSGEEYELLNLKINKLKLKNVKILPFTKNIEEYYKKASIYVLSSRYEGFPMVLLEAQSYGVPIVSFDCETGPREIINNNVDGILVEKNNVIELANAITYLIKNPKKRDEFSENAIKNSKKFTTDKIIEKWEVIIQNLLEGE